LTRPRHRNPHPPSESVQHHHQAHRGHRRTGQSRTPRGARAALSLPDPRAGEHGAHHGHRPPGVTSGTWPAHLLQRIT
jgi:hypothetical protein